MAAAMVLGLLCCFCPKLFWPAVPFREEELLVMEGRVLQTVMHSQSVDVYLSQVHVSHEQGLQQDMRYDKAVLVMSLEEAQALAMKAGYKVLSYCTYRSFRTAANLGNYDEAQYFASLGVFVRADSVRTEVVQRSIWAVRQTLEEIRSDLVRSIYDAVEDPETAGILAAICTGDRTGLTQEAKSLYQKSGIIHILAISGLHISLLGMTLFRLLRRRLRVLPAAACAVFVMLGFCVMSDASASAVRATIMFVIQMAGICLGKRPDILCSWSAAFLIMVCFRPLLLTSSGFLLSFLAVLAVGTLFQSLCAFFGIARVSGYEMRQMPRTDQKERSADDGTAISLLADDENARKNRMGRKLAESFLMSLSVNLMLLPVMASVYFEIPVYAIFLNLLVIPLMSVVLGLGFLSALLGLILLILGRFFAGAGVYLVWFIRWCCTLTGYLPGSSIITGNPEPWRLILYYSLLLIAHFLFLHWAGTDDKRRPAAGPGKSEGYEGPGKSEGYEGPGKSEGYGGPGKSDRDKRTAKRRAVRAVFLIFLIIGLAVIILAGKTPIRLRISFFDVGQGDGILVENPTGTVYLIDGGSSSVKQVGKYRMEGAIKYYGVSRIDYSIISHPDSDHISGLMEILSGMPDAGKGRNSTGISIGTILMPSVPDNPNYQELCRLAEKKGVEVVDLYAGMQLKDGHLILTCLYPKDGRAFDTVNGYSAVLDLQYGEFTALLTGDLEEEGERILLEEDPAYLRKFYDVLKVAHHGSKFSSTADFLQRISPSLAVISAGEHNRYGHPHKETLQRLQDAGSRVLVTASTREIILEADTNGSIYSSAIDAELQSSSE